MVREASDVARFLAGLTVQMVMLTGLLIGPAWMLTGNFDWPRGWLAVGVLFAASAGGGLWTLRTDPGLTRERTTVQSPKTLQDGLATALIALAVISWFAAAAWDAHRLRLIPLPDTPSLGAGVGIFLAGLALILWTFRVNSFAATVVKVQTEREQRVIDTGPYARVRHPMYLGAILFFAGLGLILGSAVAALLAVPLFSIGFLPRMLIEEAVLRRDLVGYEGYQARVRARLAPGLF